MLNKEYFKKLLKEKQNLTNNTVVVYNQLIGQISLLESILEEIERNPSIDKEEKI